MVTCIDVGNTDIKIAHVNGGSVGQVCRTPTSTSPDTAADRLPIGGPESDRGRRIALVSVVPTWSVAIRDIAMRAGLEPRRGRLDHHPA